MEQLQIPLYTDFRRITLGFFDFYGKFAFDNYAIIPLLGVALPKSSFEPANIPKLPVELNRYKSYMMTIDMNAADEVKDLFAINSPLVLQDPFELIHNCGKGVPKARLNRIIELCRHSHNLLLYKNIF